MKRLSLFTILVICILLILTSCGTPTPTPPAPVSPPMPAPSPKPPPAPISPPELIPEPTPAPPSQTEPDKPKDYKKSSEIMSWLAADVPDVHDVFLDFQMQIPTRQIEGKWIQIINTGGTGPGSSFLMNADKVVDALAAMRNAYKLVTDKKLETEMRARDVSPEEIIYEVQIVYDLVTEQIEYTYAHQQQAIDWTKAYENPPVKTVDYIDKDFRIKLIIRIYDVYRKKLSIVVNKLEFILSYGEELKEELRKLEQEREEQRQQAEGQYLKLAQEYESKALAAERQADELIAGANLIPKTGKSDLDSLRNFERVESLKQEAQKYYQKATEYRKQAAHYRELASQQ